MTLSNVDVSNSFCLVEYLAFMAGNDVMQELTSLRHLGTHYLQMTKENILNNMIIFSRYEIPMIT